MLPICVGAEKLIFGWCNDMNRYWHVNGVYRSLHVSGWPVFQWKAQCPLRLHLVGGYVAIELAIITHMLSVAPTNSSLVLGQISNLSVIWPVFLPRNDAKLPMQGTPKWAGSPQEPQMHILSKNWPWELGNLDRQLRCLYLKYSVMASWPKHVGW